MSTIQDKPYDFWNDYVSDTYVINLNRRPDRLQSITERFKEYGIPFEPIEAVDAQELDPDAYRHARAGDERPRDGINGQNISRKKGVIGNNRSWLKAVQHAQDVIGQAPALEKGRSKFVAIMEDDAYALPALAPAVKSALEHMPDDAMMVYMAANHRTHYGFFPLSVEGSDTIVKPTSAMVVSSVLVNPRFLPVFESMLEANLAMQGNTLTGEGGIYPSDIVLRMLQTYLTTGVRPEEHEFNVLIDVFEEGCKREGIKHASIYALNPLPFGCVANYSDIEGGERSPDEFLNTGEITRCLDKDQVIELSSMIERLTETQDPKRTLKQQICKVTDDFSESDMSFDDLKREIERIFAERQPAPEQRHRL